MESSEPLSSPQRQRRIADRDRQRATKACDGCRRLKEKCAGGIPCQRCIRNRRKCAFTAPAVRRPNVSSRPNSREQLEPSRAEEVAELRERLHYMESLLSHYAGNINTDTKSLRDLVETIGDNRTPAGLASETSSQSEGLGPGPEITVQPLENNMTHYSGEFSHWNFAMRIQQWIDENASHQQQKGGPDVNDYFRAVELQSPLGGVASLSSLPPRFVADFLAEAFFKHAESNYFYIDKGWLLTKLDVAYSDPASVTRRDVPTVCIIFMVLAIGTQYAYLDSPPNNIDTQRGTDRSPFSEDAVGIMLYQKACELVPDVLTISSLESVQACLLLGIYTLPLDSSGLSYVYLNLAVKLSIQNGMHRRYPGDGLDPVLRETRNRVWWTAYTTERRVGIFHGRPISVPPVDVDAEMPSDCSDPMLSTTPTRLAAIQATLQLHQTLATISQEISSLKRCTKPHFTSTMNRLVSLTNGLAQWWADSPYPAAVRHSDPASVINRSDMHLNLEYCLSRIFAGRPFISLRTSKRKSPGASDISSPKSSGDDPRAILVADCVAAALTVIDICKILRDHIGLARASYTEFSSCRAALLVIISQCLQDKSMRLRQSLRDGLAMIKFMSSGSRSSRSDASLIEAFERVIAKLDAADSASDQVPESSYARFKQWETLWKHDPSSESAQSHEPTRSPWSPVGNQANRDAFSSDLAAIPIPSDFPAVNWAFESFPQTMDEFTSMFGLGSVPGSTSGDTVGAEVDGLNTWMDTNLESM